MLCFVIQHQAADTVTKLQSQHAHMCGCTGPEAQELLKQLKDASPDASLTEFTRLHPHFSTHSGYASVLSTQSHAVGGIMVNTLLVQHTEPDTHLDAQQVST